MMGVRMYSWVTHCWRFVIIFFLHNLCFSVHIQNTYYTYCRYSLPWWRRDIKCRIRPLYTQRVVKGGAVSRNNRNKGSPVSNPTKCIWRLEPDRRYSPKCYLTFWGMTIYNDTLNWSDITPICEFITELDFNTDFDLITEFWRFP